MLLLSEGDGYQNVNDFGSIASAKALASVSVSAAQLVRPGKSVTKPNVEVTVKEIGEFEEQPQKLVEEHQRGNEFQKTSDTDHAAAHIVVDDSQKSSLDPTSIEPAANTANTPFSSVDCSNWHAGAMSEDFKLSATLKGHEEDVRALVYPEPRMLFSVSRDNTIRQWNLISEKPLTYDDTIAVQGSHWFNGVAYAPPSNAHPSGLIAAGGRETFVFIKQVGRPPDEDPYRLLIGHAGNITCLAFSEDGNQIVSGGWDSQVFVWDVEQGSVVAELTGHDGPVWGVLVYDAKLVLTACADKMIRIFDINGKRLKTIKGHTDVVRCFCKLPPDHWSGAGFASAGNDEVIRLWTLDGTSMGVLEGHNGYIYSLALLPDGDIVSSSEDRTVKIWRDGYCIQTITHPAVSIWAVAACDRTGDIASGGSDNLIRIFSRVPDRHADPESLASFDETNRMYAIPAETANQGAPFQKENLPGPEALRTQVGQREGQQLFVREDDGSVTAHLWSSSSSQWNLIGTVVSGEGSGSTKKMHNGKEYDYVFNIDIEEGKPPLKLPYNLSENPWDAARKFLQDNELPFSYYEEVGNWITQNTQGARLGTDIRGQEVGGQNSATPDARPSASRSRSGRNRDRAPDTPRPPDDYIGSVPRDPLGTERRYRPVENGASVSSGFRKLPQRRYIEILEGNAQNAVNRINDSRKELRESGKTNSDGDLTDEDIKSLQKLVDQIHNSPRDPHPMADQITALMKVCTVWPTLSRVPGVALLARLAVSPSFVQSTLSGKTDVFQICMGAGLFLPSQTTANNAVHAIRLLVNLFASDPGLLILDGSIDTALNVVRPFAEHPESPAQFKAIASLYLNFSVLLTSGAQSPESVNREARADVLLRDIGVLLECEGPYGGDGEALFRALCALGTLLTFGENFRSKMKNGVSGTLHLLSTKPEAQLVNVKEVIQEIRDELR